MFCKHVTGSICPRACRGIRAPPPQQKREHDTERRDTQPQTEERGVIEKRYCPVSFWQFNPGESVPTGDRYVARRTVWVFYGGNPARMEILVEDKNPRLCAFVRYPHRGRLLRGHDSASFGVGKERFAKVRRIYEFFSTF